MEDIYHGKFKLIEEKVGKDHSNSYLNRYACPFCGGELIVKPSFAISGKRLSCGCTTRDSFGNLIKHHHQVHTSLYNRWKSIKVRTNPNRSKSRDDRWYNAKGIRLCDEWRDFNKFYEWSMANGYREDLEIDRIDANGDYCPENCQWITHVENVRKKSDIKTKVEEVVEIKNLLNEGCLVREIHEKTNYPKWLISQVKKGIAWIDVQATVPKVHTAEIMCFNYFLKTLDTPKETLILNGKDWKANIMLDKGFYFTTFSTDITLNDANMFIKKNYPDLVRSSSKIVFVNNRKFRQEGCNVTMYYKPL